VSPVTATPLLSLRGIGKAYGPVVAVREVDLDIFAGEVVAICGDNGAGKSSLIKVISGAEEATSGTVSMRGKEVIFASPHDALSHGLATIYQDLALAPRLSIAQNVFMGSELTRPLLLPFLRVLDKKRMAQEARGFLKQLSVTVEDMDPAGRAAVGWPAPGGGDLARAALEGRDHHHGRADGGAWRQGDRPRPRPDPQAQG
jgi:ABC-type sugar transport system ATPase subunit